MFRLAAAALVAAGLALATPVSAGEFNKKLNIGDPAPSWSNLPGVDGKNHSLSDLKDKDVVVVCITCNHCPVAVAYEDRIINFVKKHCGPESKVAFVAINVNNLEADRLPKMIERAKEKGFNFPYLHDESQRIGREFGATVTPEFFVLNKERKVVYMGAMDDSNDPSKVKVNYLEAAVEAALKGDKPSQAETKARGCSVKYEKK
ncbi:MAG: thioredoxin family protein [Gemmataceae bacterium]|nr:thioredoxin family protein [Gemmataceae bacterium]MDW8264708.1 thioredoxin family protein [Gemmataceae bacterium]